MNITYLQRAFGVIPASGKKNGAIGGDGNPATDDKCANMKEFDRGPQSGMIRIESSPAFQGAGQKFLHGSASYVAAVSDRRFSSLQQHSVCGTGKPAVRHR